MENLNDYSYLIVGITSYLAGIFTGIWIRSFFKKDLKLTGNEIVLVVVSMIWALSMIIDIISINYETSPFVHGLMGAIVGFYYKNKKDV